MRDAEFYKRLSVDLKSSIPEAGGLSVSNLKYMRYFYALYAYRQQVVDDIKTGSARYRQQVVDDKELSEVAAELILIPWGHHINITDYELKKVLPTQAQLAKCYADAEARFATSAPCKVKKGGRK